MIKAHKIGNVEKDVCSQEQKIAYNIAFRCYINYSDEWENTKDRNGFLEDIINFYIECFNRNYAKTAKRLNMDTVKQALWSGLANYMDKSFIACDYPEVGKAFPID